ncbi:MAG: c-type cytochrome [Steroidobacteraceae bacterium]
MTDHPRRPTAAPVGLALTAMLPCFAFANAPAAPAADIAPCEACHGAQGEGMAAAHGPRLAGQSSDYLRKQLDDFAHGTRDNPIMRNFAAALSGQRRAELAARYASMSAPFVAQRKADAANLARGHQLASQGDEAKRVQACNSCHGPDGSGVAHSAPYLAGQSAEYLAGALTAFRRGTRKNDAGELMRSIARRLDELDVAAVSGYFAGLEPSVR